MELLLVPVKELELSTVGEGRILGVCGGDYIIAAPLGKSDPQKVFFDSFSNGSEETISTPTVHALSEDGTGHMVDLICFRAFSVPSE